MAKTEDYFTIVSEISYSLEWIQILAALVHGVLMWSSKMKL